MKFHSDTFSKKFGEMFHREHLDKYARVNPQKHWKRIVIVYTFLVCLTALFSGYVYFKVSRGEFFATEVDTSSRTVTINREKLNATITFFETKQARFEEEKAAIPSSVDPRL
jgi:hypothetical protein